MSVKGFTYEISSGQGVFSFSADAGENTNVWFKKYSTPSAFEAEEVEYGSSWSWMGSPGAVEAPSNGGLNPEIGAKLSVHQIPDGTQDGVFNHVGSDPRAITFDGEYYWVTDRGQDQIYKLDENANPTGNGFAWTNGNDPVGAVWDGSYLWISDRGSGTLYQVDTTGTQLKSFSITGVSGSRRSLAWDGSYLDYVTDNSGGSIYRIKTDGTEVANFNLSHGCAGLTFDGKYKWVSGQNGLVYQYTEDYFTEVSTYPVVKGDVSWDGKYMYETHFSTNTIYRMTGSASLDISYRVNSIV